MNAAKSKLTDEMRMSSKEFDRIMGRALQVKPDEEMQKPKLVSKAAARKKRDVRK
jgi:hypothetical protein